MNSVIKRTFIFTYVYVLCMVGTDGELIYLRVTGVYDSKSSIIVSDAFSTELDDKFPLELCRVKLNWHSLLTPRLFML